jgi:hypothetical protein
MSYRSYNRSIWLSQVKYSIRGKLKKYFGEQETKIEDGNSLNFGSEIDGARNIDSSFVNASSYHPLSYKDWQSGILNLTQKSDNFVSLKFGDGDYFFLKQIEIGSAAPGNRALSVPYSDLDMKPFYDGIALANQIACESVLSNLESFREMFGARTPDYPAEYLYGSIANRWLLKSLDGKLGFIGAAPKIDLIEKLLEHQIYRDYLGIQGEVSLIRIPQKFACDDILSTRRMISDQINIDSNKTFLMGVGHAKFGLVEELKKFKHAQFIDIGSGIDALAGIIDIRRPYFADWWNFRFADPITYTDIDLLQASNFGSVILIP